MALSMQIVVNKNGDAKEFFTLILIFNNKIAVLMSQLFQNTLG